MSNTDVANFFQQKSETKRRRKIVEVELYCRIADSECSLMIATDNTKKKDVVLLVLLNLCKTSVQFESMIQMGLFDLSLFTLSQLKFHWK